DWHPFDSHQVHNISFEHAEVTLPKRITPYIGINSNNVRNLSDWNEQLVLVENVQFVQGPQGEIPSFVWLYLVENESLQFDGMLYRSTREGAYKFLPRLINRESGVLAWNPADFEHGIAVNQVQGTPQIVN